MNNGSISALLSFLDRLKQASLYYTLSDHTHGAIVVEIVVPGERWEVEFHEDGEIGVEVFVSRDGVKGEEAITELFSRFGEN